MPIFFGFSDSIATESLLSRKQILNGLAEYCQPTSPRNMCGIVIAWPMFHPRVSRFNREFKQPEDNDKDRVTSYGYRYRPCP